MCSKCARVCCVRFVCVLVSGVSMMLMSIVMVLDMVMVMVTSVAVMCVFFWADGIG